MPVAAIPTLVVPVIFTVPASTRNASPGVFVPERVSVPPPCLTKPRRTPAVGPSWMVPEKVLSPPAFPAKNHLPAPPPFSIVPLPARPPTVMSAATWILPPATFSTPVTEWFVVLVSVSVPAPAFVKLYPEPLTIWVIARVPALIVTVRVPLGPPMVAAAPVPTVPAVKFRLCVPVKVKSPFQFCALAAVVMMAPALVLSSVPPLITSAPTAVLPMAEELLILRVPPLSTVLPV